MDHDKLRQSLETAAMLPMRNYSYDQNFSGHITIVASFRLSEYDLFTKYDPLVSKLVRNTPFSSLAKDAAYLVFPPSTHPIHAYVKEIQIYASCDSMDRIISIMFSCPSAESFSTMVERAARARCDEEFNRQLEQVISNGQ